MSTPPEDVTIAETPTGWQRVHCQRCTYVGVMSTRPAAIAAAWTHHNTHRRNHA